MNVKQQKSETKIHPHTGPEHHCECLGGVLPNLTGAVRRVSVTLGEISNFGIVWRTSRWMEGDRCYSSILGCVTRGQEFLLLVCAVNKYLDSELRDLFPENELLPFP